MVQPGGACDFKCFPLNAQAPRGGQLRLAVIVAGLLFVWAFAGQTLPALQQYVLRFGELQLQAKVIGRQLGGVTRSLRLQRPVTQFNGHVRFTGKSNAKTIARNALVMPELFTINIRDGGVRKQQLPGGKL